MFTSGRKSSRKKSGFRKSTFGQDCQIKGFLEKKSQGAFKRWQRRYFEVAGHYLRCAIDDNHIEEDIKSATDLNRLSLAQIECR